MSEERRQLKGKIAALLHQTAEDHHVAYKETDGVDPDWSIWYAGHLLEQGFDKMLDTTLADERSSWRALGILLC